MSNLRDRLKRIKETRKDEVKKQKDNNSNEEIILEGWQSCGYKVIKREIIKKFPFKLIKNIPSSACIFIPDLRKIANIKLEDFLFFDLETTGLGGAGTAAFLSAFGRIIGDSLHITQYLLLDYPGENNFLENTINEIKTKNAVIVSYNGKSFDAQIIKSRCLMNRIMPPDFFHADLLHSSRRLWKGILENCSQASIESGMLGIERKDDIPGALAPEIWFEFLKTGNTDRLIGICDHNIYDIAGLAYILNTVLKIAENPLNSKYQYNAERVALYWRRNLKNNNYFTEDLKIETEKILRFAADNNYKNALYLYSYDQLRNKNYDEAYKYILRALEIFDKESIWYEKLTRRKLRLEKYLHT